MHSATGRQRGAFDPPLPTPGIERALQRNPGYDARGLLSGSQGTLDALLSSMADDPFWMAGALEPAPLGPTERRAATAALAAAVQVRARGEASKRRAQALGTLLQYRYAAAWWLALHTQSNNTHLLVLQGGGAMFGLISASRQVVALNSGHGGPQLCATDAQLLLNFLASNDALR